MGPEKQGGILLTSGKPFDLSGLQFPSVYKEGAGRGGLQGLIVLFMTEILQRFEETPPLAPAQDYGCTVDSLVPLACLRQTLQWATWEREEFLLHRVRASPIVSMHCDNSI